MSWISLCPVSVHDCTDLRILKLQDDRAIYRKMEGVCIWMRTDGRKAGALPAEPFAI